MNRRFKYIVTYMVAVKKEQVVFEDCTLSNFVKKIDRFQRTNMDFDVNHILDIKQELVEVLPMHHSYVDGELHKLEYDPELGTMLKEVKCKLLKN